MKNLATCKPTEFLQQTNKIRKAVAKWLKDIDLFNIRSRLPELEKATDEMSADELQQLKARNQKLIERKTQENMWKILDNAMDKYPEETLTILALVCFIEPSRVDDYPMEEYLEAISELISNKSVIRFFTSLASLGSLNF